MERELAGHNAYLQELAQKRSDTLTNSQGWNSAWELVCTIPAKSANSSRPFEFRAIAETNARFSAIRDRFLSSCVRHRENLYNGEFCEAPRLRIVGIDCVWNHKLSQCYLANESWLEMASPRCETPAELITFSVPDSETNEVMLFHGANRDVVEEICRDRPDAQRGGESNGALFGRGFYLAANASKADIYADHKKCAGYERHIILVRASLGKIHTEVGRTMNRKTIRAPDGCDSVYVPGTEANSSAKVDHPEIVVFKDAQLLPMYRIRYVHEDECQCAACGLRRASDSESG